ncbi:chaplin [Streptacidiphilus sp. EB103A]|uniref:chaplin n=1 Tax=Streptacidiphilus sp. EB103A TaxID=3156275 RepID=UPI0035126ED3
MNVRKGALVVTAAGAAVLAGAGAASAQSVAAGHTEGSPGVVSGNTVQVPVHIPVNVCGNSVNVIGLLNPAFGNCCHND